MACNGWIRCGFVGTQHVFRNSREIEVGSGTGMPEREGVFVDRAGTTRGFNEDIKGFFDFSFNRDSLGDRIHDNVMNALLGEGMGVVVGGPNREDVRRDCLRRK